jgi:hypothetical protein
MKPMMNKPGIVYSEAGKRMKAKNKEGSIRKSRFEKE